MQEGINGCINQWMNQWMDQCINYLGCVSERRNEHMNERLIHLFILTTTEGLVTIKILEAPNHHCISCLHKPFLIITKNHLDNQGASSVTYSVKDNMYGYNNYVN